MKSVRRFILIHRRWFAAALLGVAVFGALGAMRAEPPGVPVVVASHDLAAGHTLSSGDLRTARMSEKPSAAELSTAQLTGRVVAAPMRAGEVISDRRLLGPDLLAGYDDDAVLMRVAVDSASARAVGVGDVVSVLGGDKKTEYLATRVRVAMGDKQPGRSEPGRSGPGSFGESLVGLIVPRDQAPKLARDPKAGLTLVLEHRQGP